MGQSLPHREAVSLQHPGAIRWTIQMPQKGVTKLIGKSGMEEEHYAVRGEAKRDSELNFYGW